MDLEQYAASINAEAKLSKTLAADAVDRATKAVEHAINTGLLLVEAKKLVERGGWDKWVGASANDGALAFGTIQASKYIRIGTHKAEARAITRESKDPPTIDDLCKVLPKASEEPIITEADPSTLGYAGVSEHNKKTRDSDDWHTPIEYVDCAREVMGSIDLDPFSTPEANAYIGAKRFLTIADDALITPWASPTTRNVWMNPPYGRGIMTKAIQRFLDQHEAGAFQQAVVLTNCASDTYWYHDMLKASNGVCQTLGRIAFISGDKEMSGNTKGQAFFYFGPNLAKFKEVFVKHGWVASTEDYE